MLYRSGLGNTERLDNQNLNELQLIKYKEKPVEEEDILAYLWTIRVLMLNCFPGTQMKMVGL